jgi:hypothetical protein
MRQEKRGGGLQTKYQNADALREESKVDKKQNCDCAV